MNTGLLSSSDLKKWTGYERNGDIERFCKENGIKITVCKGGNICTTLAAVEKAFTGKAENGDFDEIEFT